MKVQMQLQNQNFLIIQQLSIPKNINKKKAQGRSDEKVLDCN